MKSILELFAKDEIRIASRYYQHSKEDLRKYEVSEDLEKKILEKLGGGGKELFERYNRINNELQSIIRIDDFIYGYQLGALMIIDIYKVLDFLSLDDEKKK